LQFGSRTTATTDTIVFIIAPFREKDKVAAFHGWLITPSALLHFGAFLATGIETKHPGSEISA
jgi:hypothetical protein